MKHPSDSPLTISASSPAVQPIVVNYFMSGNAAQGSDYTLMPNQMVVPAGQSSANIVLTVTTTKTRGHEKATMTLLAMMHAGIHWEALKLWLKGIKLRVRTPVAEPAQFIVAQSPHAEESSGSHA